MNLSPVTTGVFAKNGEDTTGDGIPDSWGAGDRRRVF